MAIALSGAEWTLRCEHCAHAGAPAGLMNRTLKASVPGCAHQALESAGLLQSTDIGDGEAGQEWVGHADWCWERTFDVSAEVLQHQQVDLEFESIDTVAQVRVNGTPVGNVANQFHPQRFGVRHLLRAKGNEICVSIRAPVPWVRERERERGTRPVNGGWTPYPFVRKSACSFGWDWGPRAPSSGLGPVRLEAWNGVRIASVRPLVTKCTEHEAVVHVHVDLQWADQSVGVRAPCMVRARLSGPDGRHWSAEATVVEGTCVVPLIVPQPRRWWPRERGAQELHDLRVQVTPLRQGDIDTVLETRQPLDSWRKRIGLRSVELDTRIDEYGQRFAIVVNGQPVFCKGANWIPSSLHPIGVESDRSRRLLELACEANLNMLRVWGGGIYEPDSFYERCDELGILVWQDFMFACATYPEEEPYPQLIEREARYQVARLSCHPSVVLWCGGNEDVLAWQSWGFRQQLRPGQTWGQHYWLTMLPSVCSEIDSTRPYWPESPWSGSLDVHANDPTMGDRHTWDLQVEEYRTQVPRFVSECGHQSPANLRTLREALGDSALTIGGAALAHRQRAGGGDHAQYAQPLAQHFHAALDFDQWLYQAHLLQARAMALACTWLRANAPRAMGFLFWQWNDVWTGPTWSAVDVRLRTKPIWHALQRAAAARMVSVEPLGAKGVTNGGQSGDLRAAVVNDKAHEWSCHVLVSRMTLQGKELASARERVQVAPWGVDSTLNVEHMVGPPTDPTAECLMVEADGVRGWWMYRREILLKHQPALIQWHTTGRGRMWTVHVRARSLVRDLWIEPRCAWVTCAPNLLTLLPGEEASIYMELQHPADTSPSLRIHAAGGVEF